MIIPESESKYFDKILKVSFDLQIKVNNRGLKEWNIHSNKKCKNSIKREY